jgi:hypothetical protein
VDPWENRVLHHASGERPDAGPEVLGGNTVASAPRRSGPRLGRYEPARFAEPPPHGPNRRHHGGAVAIALAKVGDHGVGTLPCREATFGFFPEPGPRVRPGLQTERAGVLHTSNVRLERTCPTRTRDAGRRPDRAEPFGELPASSATEERVAAVSGAQPHRDPMCQMKLRARAPARVPADRALRRAAPGRTNRLDSPSLVDFGPSFAHLPIVPRSPVTALHPNVTIASQLCVVSCNDWLIRRRPIGYHPASRRTTVVGFEAGLRTDGRNGGPESRCPIVWSSAFAGRARATDIRPRPDVALPHPGALALILHPSILNGTVRARCSVTRAGACYLSGMLVGVIGSGSAVSPTR